MRLWLFLPTLFLSACFAELSPTPLDQELTPVARQLLESEGLSIGPRYSQSQLRTEARYETAQDFLRLNTLKEIESSLGPDLAKYLKPDGRIILRGLRTEKNDLGGKISLLSLFLIPTSISESSARLAYRDRSGLLHEHSLLFSRQWIGLFISALALFPGFSFGYQDKIHYEHAITTLINEVAKAREKGGNQYNYEDN